ncbi:MAG: DUF4212 domain-containing protein [Bacteroidetes bacterium]|nr:MAG: DUF4212 domain-containing protein [Bacteroidota bacterium]
MPDKAAYWKAHLRLLAGLLVLWFAVGIGLPVLLVDTLNAFRIAGFPLGFWMAFQGAFLLFPLLALLYARRMRYLERKYLQPGDRQGTDTP